jgi:hypothetical protein
MRIAVTVPPTGLDRSAGMADHGTMAFEVPDTIVCVDCGGVCHRLTHPPPDEPFAPGDLVAYRCEDCLDRWDVEMSDDDS